MSAINQRLWLGRVLIGLVLFFNLQCAVVFIISPGVFMPGFELSGAEGIGMVRGLGLLFLMWNVPYGVALLHPVRYRLSLYEAIIMQGMGFFGETLLLITFPPGHPVLQSTVQRFMLFDGCGLAALLIAAWVTRAVQLSTAVSAAAPADKS